MITQPAGSIAYHGPFKKDAKNWDYSTWTSPAYSPGFGATELVSSWDAQTRGAPG